MKKYTYALLTLFMLLVGCSPTVYIHTDSPGHEDTIRDAGKLLHVKMRVTDDPVGAISVEFHPATGDLCGQALERVVGVASPREALVEGVVDCTPKGWSCDKAVYLAHEAAHVLGLNHKDGTLMDPAPELDAKLTKRQKIFVQGGAILFDQLCRQPGAESEPVTPTSEPVTTSEPPVTPTEPVTTSEPPVTPTEPVTTTEPATPTTE